MPEHSDFLQKLGLTLRNTFPIRQDNISKNELRNIATCKV